MWDKLILNSIRKQRRELAEETERTLSLVVYPKEVRMEENIPYGEDPALLLDGFYPLDSSRTYPAIIDIHGGGLVMGHKEQNRQFCLDLAKEGYLVYVMDYSLVPESNVFSILEEIRTSFEVIYEKLKENPSFNGEIFGVGDSAGAFLLLYTLAIKGNRSISDAFGIKPISFSIKAAAFQNGMFYSIRRDKIGLLSDNFYGRHFRTLPCYPYLNPENNEVLGSLPPFFFFTTEKDFLGHYSRSYSKAVQKTQTDCVFIDYPFPLEHAHACLYPRKKESQMINGDMLAFFRKFQKNR
ncbi:MAG: alpha/beta hydrolase [Spirochaetales bacterium]|nr:alpha/beta hydrolase [Candidatus Physcosoma equi]